MFESSPTKSIDRHPASGVVAKSALLSALVVAGGILFMLGAIERRMIYYPTTEMEATPALVGLAYEDVHVEAQDGTRLHGWFVPCTDAVATLLFLHGNAGNISHRVDNIRRLHDIGLNVFILDYRGYGLSQGKPREKGLFMDAEAGFSYLASRQDIDSKRVAVFGRSLGGAVAVDLCSHADCKRLILESTFTSAADMANAMLPFLPVGRFLPERFDSISKIGKIRVPLLQFHGTRDEVVPYKLGERLFQAATCPKEFVPIPGAGHNDTYVVGGVAYFEKIRTFLAGADSAP